MRSWLLAALAVACLMHIAGPAAAAAWDGPTRELNVTASDAGGRYWFEVEGLSGRDPDVHIEPGARVTIHLFNNGTSPHNFWVSALGGVPCCVAPGERGEGSFIAPTADTNVAYVCQPHEAMGMKGTFVVGEGADQTTPAPFLLAPLAVALALSLRKPFGKDPRRRDQ